MRECGVDREVLLKRVEVRWHDFVGYLRICRERAILKYEADAGFLPSEQRQVKQHFCGFFGLDPKFTPLTATEVRQVLQGKGEQSFGKGKNRQRKLESRFFGAEEGLGTGLNKKMMIGGAKGSSSRGSASPMSSPEKATVFDVAGGGPRAAEDTDASGKEKSAGELFEEDILMIPLFPNRSGDEDDEAGNESEGDDEPSHGSRLEGLGLVDRGKALEPVMGRRHRKREQKKKFSAFEAKVARQIASGAAAAAAAAVHVMIPGRAGAPGSPGGLTSGSGSTSQNSASHHCATSLTKTDLSHVGSYDPYKKIDPEKELDPGLYNGTKPVTQQAARFPEALVQLDISAPRVKKFLGEVWPSCKHSVENREWLEVQMAYLQTSFGPKFGFNHALHFCKAVQEKCRREQRDAAALALIKPVEHYPGLVTFSSDASAAARRIFDKLADTPENDCAAFLQVQTLWITRLPRSEQLDELINDEPY
eukprot:g6647.t1